MHNVTVPDNIFHLRVGDAAVVLEKRRQVAASDKAALVDCRRQDGAPVFAKPDRIVRTPTEERDAKRRASDYHLFSAFPVYEDNGSAAMDASAVHITEDFKKMSFLT
jgi:hypothetical protein